MNKAPWWYWPVSLIPMTICAVLGSILFHMRIFRDEKLTGRFETNTLILGFMVYAALVVLGYLLLVFGKSEIQRQEIEYGQ